MHLVKQLAAQSPKPAVDDPAPIGYAELMAEGELSKRIDDLHKRFDDLRADIDRRFSDLRADMDKRFSDLRADMGARFAAVDKRLDDMNQTLRTFMWVVSGWFTFLTAVLAVFGFLRR